MFGNQPLFKFYLLLLDAIVIILSVLFAESRIIVSPFLYIVPISLLSLLFNNLYKRNIIYTRYRQTVLLIKSISIACFISIVIMAVIQFDFITGNGRIFLFKYFFISLFALIFLRAVFVHKTIKFLSKKGLLNTNILIVGGDRTGVYVADTLEKDDVFHFNIVGFIDDYKETNVKINKKFYNLGQLKDLEGFVKSKNVDEIIIAIDGLHYDRLIKIVNKCLNTNIVVRIYSNFLDIIAKKINVEYYANLPVVMLQQQNQNSYIWKIKRIVDIVTASLGIIILFPLFLFVIAGVKLSSRGPVIFKQKRIGKNGIPFDFYKFRSMHVNTSSSEHKEYVENFIKGNADPGKKEINVFKIRNDQRIFPFGNFIRKTSIDEFPQLINVIKGDMGLIGPRPCLPYEWECYDEWHKNRLTVLPGCTGLWQVLGRSTVTFEEMVVLDLYYISNINLFLWLDLKIILQTFPVIFFGKGGF